MTGIVQEFQFGMNWSEYARFTGDIFGAPLAVEALLAFFIESTFLGVWIFGWDRLRKGVHLASIWLVAIASNLSALWILIANSFMQEPVGYAIKTVTLPDGSTVQRAVMTDFFALISNPNLRVQFPHVFFSGLLTAGFFIIGVSAWHLWRRTKNHEFFMRSMHIGVVVAAVASLMMAINGHTQAQHMVKSQPMKMAAAEALWNSEDPAAFSLFTIGDEPGRRDVFAIRIPALLSILAYNTPTGEVKGINDLQREYEEKYGPGDYVPPVAFTYWTFRTMVGLGFLMIAVSWFTLFRVMQRRLEQTRWLLRILPYMIVVPYAANTAGWLMTEVGRQPWIVFGLQQTAEAVSPNVTAGMVLLSLVLFTVIYGVLMAVDIFLLNKYAKDETQVESGVLPEPNSGAEVAVSF